MQAIGDTDRERGDFVRAGGEWQSLELFDRVADVVVDKVGGGRM